MIRRKPHLDPVPAYQPGKPIAEVLKEYGIESAIKLASNENPYGFSSKVKEAIEQSIQNLYFYPDGQAAELRSKLASFLGVGEDQLLFGAGLDEVIQMISRAIFEPGTNAVMGHPSFPMYKINALIEGAEAREIPVKDGVLDLKGMIEAIDHNTRIVWVCNPNNPTGTYLSESDLLTFLDQVPQEVLIVFDEAYYEYVTASDFPESISLLSHYPNLIILRTFSKAYGLAGLRIGYSIASPELTAIINKVRKPFNTSYLAQVAAATALLDQDFVTRSVHANREELSYAYQELKRLGLKYYPSQTNFIYIEVPMQGAQLYERMLPHGVIIRPMAGNYIRVTMGTREQNQQFFTVLERILGEV